MFLTFFTTTVQLDPSFLQHPECDRDRTLRVVRNHLVIFTYFSKWPLGQVIISKSILCFCSWLSLRQWLVAILSKVKQRNLILSTFLSPNFRPWNMGPIIKLKYVLNLLYLLQVLLLKIILIWQLFEPVDRERYWELVKKSSNMNQNNQIRKPLFYSSFCLYTFIIFHLTFLPLFLAFSLSGFLFACTIFRCFYLLQVMQVKQI